MSNSVDAESPNAYILTIFLQAEGSWDYKFMDLGPYRYLRALGEAARWERVPNFATWCIRDMEEKLIAKYEA